MSRSVWGQPQGLNKNNLWLLYLHIGPWVEPICFSSGNINDANEHKPYYLTHVESNDIFHDKRCMSINIVDPSTSCAYIYSNQCTATERDIAKIGGSYN